MGAWRGSAWHREGRAWRGGTFTKQRRAAPRALQWQNRSLRGGCLVPAAARSAQYDFSNSKRAKDVPHLAKLQAEAKGKTRITIMLDNFVIEAYKDLAQAEGMGYQTLINRALRHSLADRPLTEDALRRVLRDELGRHSRS